MEDDRRFTADPTYGPSVRGKLLVAGPALVDPNFVRTVVVMIEHNEQGALGFIVNREVSVPMGELLPSWPYPDQLAFQGGPVEGQTGLGLGLLHTSVTLPPPPEARPLLGSLYAVDLTADGAYLATIFRSLRVFFGYAGWAPGQLDRELEDFGWIVVDGEESDIFSEDPEQQWSSVLARQPGRVRELRHYPIDPAWN